MSNPTRNELITALEHVIDLLQEANKEEHIRHMDLESALYVLQQALTPDPEL